MSRLSSLLQSALVRHFPGVDVGPGAFFWPMVNLEKGEISSAAAIEIARVVKQRADEVAQSLIADLAADVPATWRSDAGYVVCQGAPAMVLLDEVPTDVGEALARLRESRNGDVDDTLQQRAICCLVPDVTEPLYARIRLIARAALHALLVLVYEGRCRVGFEPEGAHNLTSLGSLVDVFRRTVIRVLSSEDEVRTDIGEAWVERTVGSSLFIWTSHHYHEALPRAARSALADAKRTSGVTLRMPSDGWLLSRDRALPELLGRRSIERIVSALKTSEGWLRLLFHAASSVPSGDFDPAVSLYDECASPLWSLRSLRDRFSRFRSFCELPVGRASLMASLPNFERERALVLRSIYLPLFTARAIEYGELGEWCAVIEEFARRGHMFLNTPTTRLVQEKGELEGQVGAIVASVGFGLSSILGIMAEGPCVDQ